MMGFIAYTAHRDTGARIAIVGMSQTILAILMKSYFSHPIQGVHAEKFPTLAKRMVTATDTTFVGFSDLRGVIGCRFTFRLGLRKAGMI